MAPKPVLEAVDSLLQDLHQNTIPFGGDFRQVLNVLEKGSRADVVHSCLKRSLL